MIEHLKQYAIDLSVCLAAIGAKTYASFTGIQLSAGDWQIDKIIYVSVMILTGLTSAYRLIKEIRTDIQNKRKKESEGGSNVKP